MRVGFDKSRLKILRGDTRARELTERLSGEALRLRLDFERSIERSEEELEEQLVAGELVLPRPYWDDILRHERETRLGFFRSLCERGLGGFRRRIRGRIGCFFVKKKGGDQRMVIDARGPNLTHRVPPHSELGSAGALASLDVCDSTLEQDRRGGPAADLHGASVDLVDSFYQFRHRRLASWFGCEWAETAAVWGVTSVFDDDLG